MYRWLEAFHKPSGKEVDAASEENQADQVRKPKEHDTLKGHLVPLLCIPSPTSMTPLTVSGASGGTAKKFCLSDEQLQELVRFLVWLHSHPLMPAYISERSWKTEDWDLSDGSLTASEMSVGCKEDLELSEVQLKALRRICEDKSSPDAREPPTPKFGGSPRFVEDFSLAVRQSSVAAQVASPRSAEDFSLADEQLQEIVLYYHWYQDAFADASSGPGSDFVLSTDKLHKFRMICEDDIESLAPTGSTAEDPQTNICEFGLSDAQLQNLVRFSRWSWSRVPSTSLVAELDDEFGISCDQMEEIKKFYCWCQSRRQSLKACDSSSGLSEKQLEEHLAKHGNSPRIMDVDESLHFKVPNSVLLSQPKDLPAKAFEVYHGPITDQQLQDLVCLFIWSTAASEGADMEGCDDDLDLPPKELEQVKTRCVEAEGQDPHDLLGDVELASFAEDIGIAEEQLLTLIRYCSWTCTLEGKCITISETKLREVRKGCQGQVVTCSWTSNVSDERLQNLIRLYTWHCSTLGCAELGNVLGLPDKDFDELMQYLSWCESRATALRRQSSHNCCMSSPRHKMFSLMPEEVALKAMSPSTDDSSVWDVASVPETTSESPRPIIDSDVDSLPIAFEKVSKMAEFADELDNGLDSDESTQADSLAEKNTSFSPEPEVFRTRTRSVTFLLEDSDNFTDQPRKVCMEDKSIGDDAKAMSPAGTTLEGCVGSTCVYCSQGEPDLDDIVLGNTVSLRSVEEDELWDDTPTHLPASRFFSSHASPSQSPCAKAKTFCGLAEPADTCSRPSSSWEDSKAASQDSHGWPKVGPLLLPSSWQPSRTLGRFKGKTGAVVLEDQDASCCLTIPHILGLVRTS